MAQKKSRQTFEKLKREQAIREKRVRKQERKAAARLAKTYGGIDASTESTTRTPAISTADSRSSIAARVGGLELMAGRSIQ